MTRTIKRSRNPYEGLSLTALLYLTKTKAPVDLQKRSEIFQELYYRYF